MRHRRDPVPGVLAILLVLVAVAVLVATQSRAGAQDEPDGGGDDLPTELDGRIQILGVDERGDEIVLEVAVPPDIGRLAPIAANFGVTDGGQLVDFTVGRVDAAVDTVIVLDTSGSMRGSALAAAKAAASSFVAALPPDAQVGLIGFGDTVVTHNRPTSDRAALLTAIDGLSAGGTETVLWDALVAAADMVGGSEAGRSSVVVLSDGDDTASAADPASAVERFEAGSTPLFAVAIESPDTDLAALEQVVGLVGGEFLATADIGRLDSLYADIAGRLANRYRLRFSPAGEGTRTVIVSVAADGAVATASATIGGATTVTEQPEVAAPSASPPRVLNIGDQPVLGAVDSPVLGRLAGQAMLWVGLGSMFVAFVLAGLIAAGSSAQVRLDAAAGADRLGGINARLGLAADRLISRHDESRRVDSRLEAADINLKPGEFVLVWLVATTVLAMAALLVSGIALALLLFVSSFVVAAGVLGVRTNRRRSQFAEQLTGTLSIMAGSLRAGQSLPQAIELVAAEAPSPTAEEFHRISFEIRVGRDLTESIRDTATRMASADLEWLGQAVDINRELGGDLSEVMDNVAGTIRERRTIARQIDALSAEGRATAWVLLAMPVILFLFSWWRTPDNIETLVTEPLGRLLLGVAVTGMIVGHIWIRHLVRLKY